MCICITLYIYICIYVYIYIYHISYIIFTFVHVSLSFFAIVDMPWVVGITMCLGVHTPSTLAIVFFKLSKRTSSPTSSQHRNTVAIKLAVKQQADTKKSLKNAIHVPSKEPVTSEKSRDIRYLLRRWQNPRHEPKILQAAKLLRSLSLPLNQPSLTTKPLRQRIECPGTIFKIRWNGPWASIMSIIVIIIIIIIIIIIFFFFIFIFIFIFIIDISTSCGDV